MKDLYSIVQNETTKFHKELIARIVFHYHLQKTDDDLYNFPSVAIKQTTDQLSILLHISSEQAMAYYLSKRNEYFVKVGDQEKGKLAKYKQVAPFNEDYLEME